MRRSITVCVALAAFAAFVAAPGTASATNDPQLTAPAGTLLSTGSLLSGTDIGETLLTDINGNILTRCTTAIVSGTVATNSGSPGTVQWNITSGKFGGTGSTTAGAEEPECTGTFGNVTFTTNKITNGVPWCLTSNSAMSTDEFRVRGGGCSEKERAIRFVLDSTTTGEQCTYERGASAPMVGTFTTGTAEAARLNISKLEFPKIAGGFLCPGAGFLDWTFGLETSGNPAYLS
jgi:hypothetical protein